MALRTLLLAASLLTAIPAVAAAPLVTPGADVRVQVLQLESDPPNDVKKAPGGGRTLAPAMLYTPAAGANPFGPAIVMLDEGPGSHVLARGQAARFAAERLAAKGYTVVSIYTGQEKNFATTPFGDNKWAIRSALDYLEHAGYEDIAIAAQGYGAQVAADYLKSQPDRTLDNGPERRVKGLILINPLLSIRNYPRFGDAKGYDARVALTRKEMADGTGRYLTDLEPGHSTEGNQADWIMQGQYVGPAQAWIEYWSPEAAARNAALLKDLPVPTLVLAGDAVPMSPVAAAKALAGPTTQVAIVAGGGEDLLPKAGQVTDAIAGWLKAHDLGVRPGVKITTADITTEGGTPLYGMVYEPEGGADPRRPTLLLIHGRAGDTLQSSTHWMGWRFAQKGYRVIAPSMRVSGVTGIETETMAHTEADIGKWIDAATAMGATRVVLGGHSNGGIWISSYVGDTHDKRVVGMIYFAPTVDAERFQRRLVGDATYEKDNARAYKAIAEGRGLTEVMGVNTALAYVDLYGKNARTAHSDRVKEFSLPGLAIAGGKDPLMSDWFVTSFTKNYRGALTLNRYENGTHGLRESKDRLADDVAAWMGKTFP